MQSNKYKIISTVIAVLIFIQLFYFPALADEQISYTDNQIFVVDDEPPEPNYIVEIPQRRCIIEDDNIMVPFRMFWETYGAVVDWDNEHRIATAYYISEDYEFIITMFMGRKPQAGNTWSEDIITGMAVDINGISFPAFCKNNAVIRHDRIFISYDFFSDILGASIDIAQNTIIIELTDINMFEAARRESEKEEVFRLVNEYRTKNGLNLLQRDIDLDNICRLKAIDKAEYKYLGHTSEKYGTVGEMLQLLLIQYQSAGECLAWGQTTSAQVVEAWINSPGHEKILSFENADYIGIGTVKAENGCVYWSLLIIRI